MESSGDSNDIMEGPSKRPFEPGGSSTPDPKGKGKQRAASPSARGKDSYAREWDKGKSRLANDDRNHGRKRKVDEVDLNDGYENKKQRVNAASRRAPWAWDVEWDRCQNVSQM